MWKEWRLIPSTSIVSASLRRAAVLCILRILFLMQKTLFSLSVASHSFLYACVYACGHTSDMTGAQDGSVRMFEWKRPQQLICFRQAGNARVTRLYFNSQGNKVHTCTRSVLSICAVVLIHLRCAASVELLTERASSVCGRSTRHHPTLNLTWWGHLLCPHHCKVAHIYSKYTFKSIILVLFLLTELAVSL